MQYIVLDDDLLPVNYTKDELVYDSTSIVSPRPCCPIVQQYTSGDSCWGNPHLSGSFCSANFIRTSRRQNNHI